MRSFMMLLLGCCLGLSGLAQPGAFGGSLRFRLFDPQGLLISPDRSDYQCIPSWDPHSLTDYMIQHPERWQFARTFAYGRDGYWQYHSVPTPVGGIMPPGFTVVVVHGRDTMRVRGLAHVHYKSGLQVDSIPFGPGRFLVPTDYENLLNVRAGAGRIANVGWELFRNTASQPDRITAERLYFSQSEYGGPPTLSPPPCARLTVRYTEATHTSDVYLASNPGQPPKLLLRKVPGQPPATCAGSLLLLTLGSLVLKSDDEGTTWRVGQVREEARIRWHQDKVFSSFRLEQLMADGDRVLASGERSYSYQWWSEATLPGIYELHFTPDTTSPAVRRSYAKAQEDVSASLTRRTQQRKNDFLRDIKLNYLGAENQKFVRKRVLQDCLFAQNDSYLNYSTDRPIVTLQSGRFQYTGTNWTKTPTTENKVPAYKASGTYTFTDSTVTFRSLPIAQPVPAAGTVDFYPSGTYYYYCRDVFDHPLITLVRWEDVLNTDVQLTFRLMK